MSDAARWLTNVQFAAAEGCNEKQVRKGLASGKLVARADGKLDRAQVGSGWRRSRVDSKDLPTAGASNFRQMRRAEIVKRLKELDWTRTFDWREEAMRARAVNAAAAVGIDAALSELRDDGHWGGYQLRNTEVPRRAWDT
jgi:hypothetical protein